MAEASELLKRVMNAYPQIKKLSGQKLAMEDALRKKGFTYENTNGQLSDMKAYAEMIAQLNFSIDYIIEENGFTHDFGNGVTLSTMLAEILEYHKVLSNIREYDRNRFSKDEKIMYLTKKPVKDCFHFCWEVPNLLFVPRLDFSRCTSINYTLVLTNRNRYIYDEYEIDCSSLTSVYNNIPRIAKNIVFKNMGDNVTFGSPFQGLSFMESIKGLNISYMQQNMNRPWNGTVVPHLEFADGSYIRYGTILIDDYIKNPSNDSKFTLYDKFDDSTLRDLCEHAYDWNTNPNNLTDKNMVTLSDGTVVYNFKSYRFTDTAKARLAAAYPSIDFKKMMEDKGWTW